jgi:acyl-CoA synthetase (AMP-forming)/AMP-acid ligase II
VILIPHRYVATLLRGGLLDKRPDDVAYVMPPFYHAYGVFTACTNLTNGTTIVVPAVPSWPPTTQVPLSSTVCRVCARMVG